MANGDLFLDDAVRDTWTMEEAKSFFRAGMVDDFVALEAPGGRVLGLQLAGRGLVFLRSFRESDKSKARVFRTLDAAVGAAAEIGFDVRMVGVWRTVAKPARRHPSSPVSGDRPKGGGRGLYGHG